MILSQALARVRELRGESGRILRLWLECDLEQIREVLATATHVGIQVQLATAADECVFFFERAEPFQPRSGLTADYIA